MPDKIQGPRERQTLRMGPGINCGPNRIERRSATSASIGLRELPVIPSTAYNVLNGPEVQNAINQGLVNDEARKTELLRIKNPGQGFGLNFDEHIAQLMSFGSQMGLKGTTVYYPFGGFDPYTPFTLIDGANDVFAMGIESFGAVKDIVKFCHRGSAYDKAGFKFKSFDSIRDMAMIAQENGIQGLGAIAIARIISFMGGTIDRISYFDIQSDGSLRFFNANETMKSGSCKSAVVEFTVIDPQAGQPTKKRYWYINHNIYDGIFTGALFSNIDARLVSTCKETLHRLGYTNAEDIILTKIEEAGRDAIFPVMPDQQAPLTTMIEVLRQSYQGNLRYERFIGRLRFQTMLIKAANNMWEKDEDDASSLGYNKIGYLKILMRKTLQPAIENEAMVVSDNRSAGWGGKSGFAPHSIWKCTPRAIALGKDQSFGYSREGDHIYYGPASWLIEQNS